MTTLCSEGTFWTWAVAAYGAEGVAQACLELQDRHGQCVPLLLWAAWQQSQGTGLTPDEAASAADLARTWSEAVITPLRAVRRRLKESVEGDDPAEREDLRASVKAAELAAERALMTRLERLCVTGGEVGDAVDRVARAWSPDLQSQALVPLLQALTKGEILSYSERLGKP